MTSRNHEIDQPESGPAPSHITREDSERFRLLVENSLDLVVEVSLDGDILYTSPNVRSVLGYTPAEFVGTNARDRVHPDDLAQVLLQFSRPDRHQATCRYRHQDGSWRWLETTGRDFTTATGQRRGVLVARDVTRYKQNEIDRERLETELHKMEKLTVLGTLAAGIAHDFNNILTAIIAHTWMAREESTEPSVRGGLDEVLRATDRAKDLAQQILNFTSQQKRTQQPVQLSAVVHEVLKLVEPTLPANIEVRLNLWDESGRVLADPTQIHQVLVNLCNNAIHAMRAKRGRLELQLAGVAVDAEIIRNCPGLSPGPHARLSVIDTGHGMDSVTQRRIFESLFTTKRPDEGTGLGLAVVHRIMKEHSGAIQVVSRPGEGATFHLFFPLYLEAAAPATAQSTA